MLYVDKRGFNLFLICGFHGRNRKNTNSSFEDIRKYTPEV